MIGNLECRDRERHTCPKMVPCGCKANKDVAEGFVGQEKFACYTVDFQNVRGDSQIAPFLFK